MKLEFSRQIFEKYPDIKFYENPFSGSRVLTCGRTDMTKLIVAFLNFANAPNRKLEVSGLLILQFMVRVAYERAVYTLIIIITSIFAQYKTRSKNLFP